MESELSLSPHQQKLFWAKVSKGEECWEWLGSKTPLGYGKFILKIGGRWKPRGAHRIAYVDAKGPIPRGMVIDHLCHNPTCVNPEHLRATTYRRNSENRSGANSNSKSGVRGVCWDKKTGKWRVQVGHAGRVYRGGFFDVLADAERAAIRLRGNLFGTEEAA